jgi:SPP1 gp7 family putative phage head morphogenesis protein
MAESPQILINDAIRRQVLLEGVKAGEAEKFRAFLKTLETDLRDRLTSEGETIRNRTRLRILLSDVRQIESDVFDEWIKQLELDLDDIALTEANLEAEVLTEVIEEFDAVKPAPAQILTAYQQAALSLRGKSQGLTLKPFLKQYTADQTALIEGIISQGFTEGRTTQQIVTDLRGTRANKFNDGVLARVDRNTTTMVRTAVQNASSQAKQKIWNANTDAIASVEWVSTLDSRTTVQCRSLDGRIFPVDEGPRPPIHYGCRSTIAPVLDEKYDFLRQGSKRPAKGAKATTQVSAQTSYYSWLKTQPASFQDKILGTTRGKLLRNGGLSAERFAELQLNRRFQPITLQEMAQEAPEAFRAAKLLDDAGDVIIVRN